jgi:DNA uptake protein ComE-like DNA-binding protein
LIDINSATGEQLQATHVFDDAYSMKIIEGRPYKMKSDLKTKKISPDAIYDKLARMIIDLQK